MKLTSSQLLAAQNAASRLAVDPEWLLAVIQNESGGDPLAKNPTSSARGLIQFIDSTAQALGFSSSLALVSAYPSFEAQVQGPVVEYFRRYAPFGSKEEFIGSVFYPANRRNLDAAFPDSVVKANNNQFHTLREYVSWVWSRYKGLQLIEGSLPFLSVAAGVGIWYWWRNRRASRRRK